MMSTNSVSQLHRKHEGKNSNITGGVIMENRNFIIIGSVSIIIFTVLLIILTKFIGNKK